MVQHEINLPEGWVLKQIKDVAPLQRGFDLPASKVVSGKYPVCYSNGIANYHNEFKAEGPGVFTGRSGTIGNVFYVKENYWPHNTSLWVTDFKGNDRKFVYYLYQQVKLDRFNAGTGVPTLNRNDVHVHKIPIPKSAVEQQKIASILSTWDKAIELKEKLIEQKKEQKKGLMQRLLTGEVRLPGFDGEWQEVALGEITDISTGKKDNQDKVEYGKYPFFVRSENVERINSYSFDGEAILIPGDGRIGQIYHYIVGKFDYHQRVYKISDFSEISSGKFIYFYLSQFFHKEAMRYSAKATVDSLRLPMLTGMKIKLPALAEQNEIVGVLNIVDKEISLLEENLIYLKRQKQGLMQLLLTGKVRVKV